MSEDLTIFERVATGRLLVVPFDAQLEAARNDYEELEVVTVQQLAEVFLDEQAAAQFNAGWRVAEFMTTIAQAEAADDVPG